MSILGLIAGTDTLLVGVEEQDDGGLRMYFGHRSRGLYALVYDEDVKQQVREAWATGQRVIVPMPPPDCIYHEGAVS